MIVRMMLIVVMEVMMTMLVFNEGDYDDGADDDDSADDDDDDGDDGGDDGGDAGADDVD